MINYWCLGLNGSPFFHINHRSCKTTNNIISLSANLLAQGRHFFVIHKLGFHNTLSPTPNKRHMHFGWRSMTFRIDSGLEQLWKGWQACQDKVEEHQARHVHTSWDLPKYKGSQWVWEEWCRSHLKIIFIIINWSIQRVWIRVWTLLAYLERGTASGESFITVQWKVPNPSRGRCSLMLSVLPKIPQWSMRLGSIHHMVLHQMKHINP